MVSVAMSGLPATDEAAAPVVPGLTGRQALTVLVLLLVAGWPHYRVISPHSTLTGFTDLDGQAKLHGIEADPSLRAALGWFFGDDPQRVHTFRPLPAFSLWVEYRLWGWTRWPYQVMNALYLALTALAVVWVCRVMRMPLVFAVAAGVLLMALPSRGSYAVVGLVATRHDLLCTLFGVLAFGSLLAWLEAGQRRHLAGVIVWSLLAHLSKEMAITLTPMFATVALAHRGRRPSRRLLLATLAAATVTVFWLAWYRLAEANMAPSPHPSHSFGGMIELLVKRASNVPFFFIASLSEPLALFLRYLIGVRGWYMLCSTHFWQALAEVCIFVGAIIITWRHARRWLVLLYLWKVFAYLPVLPLSDTWAWYEFMPHILDPILPVATAWCLCYPMDVPRRARRWWRARRDLSSAEQVKSG